MLRMNQEQEPEPALYTGRQQPTPDRATVSVTFRRMTPNEFVVRYVMWSFTQMSRPPHCSVNVVIEKRDNGYLVEMRAPQYQRTKPSAESGNVIAALRDVLRQVELSR